MKETLQESCIIQLQTKSCSLFTMNYKKCECSLFMPLSKIRDWYFYKKKIKKLIIWWERYKLNLKTNEDIDLNLIYSIQDRVSNAWKL